MKNYLLSILAAVAVLCTACGGDDEPAKVNATGVKLDKTMVVLEVGESTTVKATLAPENATNKKVKWAVKNTAIATVNNGVVKGVAVGETELTATTVDGGHTATIPVKVVTEKVPVTGISFAGFLSGDNPTLKEGMLSNTFVMFTPENATNKNLTFTCDKPELVSIQEDASYLDDGFITYTITAIKAGDVKFTAVSEDGGFTITSTMTILPIVKVSEIRIGPENATIEVGETKQFAAAIIPSDAENKEVEWSSSDTSVATVKVTSNNYIAEVTGVSKGTATITATAKDGSGVKGETTITVVGAMPTALTINGAKTPDAIYTWHGKEVTLDLACTPANADISRLYWDIHTDSYSANADAVKYEFSANTLKLSFEHSQSTSVDETIYVRAWDSEKKSTYYGGINVAYQTVSWLVDAKYKFDVNSSIFPFAGKGDDMEKFNWNKDDYTSGLNFIAYYYTDGLANVVSPYSEGAQHYYEYYIPSSEYTLTSSDESKIKVTKNDDDKSWKIERLNTTDLVAVTLTYKCGEHTQTYTLNLIP